MNAAAPLKIDQVSHRYRSVLAVDDITLDIPSGCLVGFIGPDGVGKSSLLGLIAGAKRLQTGQISVLGGHIAHTKIGPDTFAAFGFFF